MAGTLLNFCSEAAQNYLEAAAAQKEKDKAESGSNEGTI